jgi:hypothetical protein
MIITVKEAQQMKCPYSPSEANCTGGSIKDGCPAWRWLPPDKYYREEILIMDNGKARAKRTKVGYCGRAGKPTL